MSSNRPTDRGHANEPRVDPLLEVREKRKGQRLGDTYVRIVRPFEDEFERGEEGRLIASERTLRSRSGWFATLRRIRTVLVGRPISSDHETHERLTKVKALAVLSSDNISSSAYATEEMMRILVLAGIGAFSLIDAAHAADRRRAGDRRDQLPADDQGLPAGRQQLHRGQRQPGRPCPV